MNTIVRKHALKIKNFYIRNQRMPSYEEIAKMFGFASKNASYKLVQRLIKEGILDKDEIGKIIPKNLVNIPHPEIAELPVTPNALREVAGQLLDITHPLAEAYPVPNTNNKFLQILIATYRRNTFTLLAIYYLSQNEALADSAMDLMRKMIEDVVSIEYMIAFGKDELADRFQKFLWMQLHQDKEFLETIGADFDALGLSEKPDEVEQRYQEVRAEFMHRKGIDSRSWIGKDVETMLKELGEKGALDQFDISRAAIGYIRACWKNHFNPYDVISYTSGDLLDVNKQQSLSHSLLFGMICLFRLTIRYINEVRETTQDNSQFEEIHQKVKTAWNKLNPE